MAKSIVHILNAKIQNLMPIKFNRETDKYQIYYEEKIYSIHKLLVKIEKDVDIQKDELDINVNVYNRMKIKFNVNQMQLMLRPDMEIDKTIAMRITKTRYPNLPVKYVNFLQIREKSTWVGAITKFIPFIDECGLIVKDTETCYKTISMQKANTHWLKTIAIVKPTEKQIKVGKLIIITSRFNEYEKDLYA